MSGVVEEVRGPDSVEETVPFDPPPDAEMLGVLLLAALAAAGGYWFLLAVSMVKYSWEGLYYAISSGVSSAAVIQAILTPPGVRRSLFYGFLVGAIAGAFCTALPLLF